MIIDNNIDMCVLQEVEIKAGYDVEALSFRGYNLMVENNETNMCTIYSILNVIHQ